MDTDTLVEEQIEEGRELLIRLDHDHFDVTASFWLKTSEEERWILYIASSMVDRGLSAAYREVYGLLHSMESPWISMSDVKLISPTHPIAVEVLENQHRYPPRIPTRMRRPRLGGVGIDEVCIYPPPGSETASLRLSFSVTYHRQEKTDHWRATIERGELYRDLKAKGAVSYSTALWQGETAEDLKFAIVTVLLEIDSSLDDRATLDRPEVRRMMAKQAREMADKLFKEKHPDTVIEHVEDDD
jgi:hypothetical protein